MGGWWLGCENSAWRQGFGFVLISQALPGQQAAKPLASKAAMQNMLIRS
jgi:hypothetical protein